MDYKTFTELHGTLKSSLDVLGAREPTLVLNKLYLDANRVSINVSLHGQKYLLVHEESGTLEVHKMKDSVVTKRSIRFSDVSEGNFTRLV